MQHVVLYQLAGPGEEPPYLRCRVPFIGSPAPRFYP
jgi:hypothetical protein